MSGCDQVVPIGKDQLIFAKLETTCGTFIAPAAGDAVRVIGDASFMQGMGFLNDEQKRLTLSILERVPGAFNPGAFSFPMYVKPSGALGTAPRGSDILEAGFGTETITPATDVVYSLAGIADAIKSLTIVYKRGHTVFYHTGCFVNKLTFPVEAGNTQTAIGQVTVEGVFFKQVKAGYTAVNNGAGYPALDTSIVIDDAKEIDAGSLVKFGTEDNGGAGYTVSSSTISTNTIVVTPGLVNPIADDDVVNGVTPVATDAGVLVHGRYGTYQEDAVDVKIKTASIEINNNIKIIEDEKTNSAYPETAIRATNREVNLTIDEIFYRGHAKYFYDSQHATELDVDLFVGDTAAERYKFDIPKVVFDTPELSGDEEVMQSNKGIALASAAFDDEITLTFA